MANLQSSSPLNNASSVTPNDSADLTTIARAIYVGTSGSVKIDTLNGNTVTLPNLAAGVWHPIAVKRIHATGTTATDIFAGH